MSRYDLVEDLRRCASQLEEELAALQQQLTALPLLVGRVFSLPPVAKGAEHDPVTQINVTQHLGNDARQRALQHYCRLFIQHQSENVSTKAAVRLPGALCFEADDHQHALLHQQVEKVNQLKAALERIITVESGLPSEARFDFVHTHLRGLLTLNAYRAITLLDAPDSVRFGWANKHIIKNVTPQEIAEKLEKSLKAGRAQAPWTREQWAEKVQQELEAVRSLPKGARLKIKRPVKVQPIARIWDKEQQKQTQLACPSPLLVLCPDRQQVPVLGELLNYDAENITHRYKPQAEQLWLLIPRLHLYCDRPVSEV
ncbi:DNA replication terminus site-binding protein [Pantoea sp. PSNIH4]|nr:DNA replication terminus site-binding protein [Pantoea sp. PSNIH2]POU43687.1 DNA replication terminus site-binding protein [Pantoea sp. PSNIH5]POU62595.1 DNA replication terminus site-binding protein [Pantoea sp. PSNIH4]POY66541.1 DNA replication terminus site-binding protein [Pantoea sp. PSNIH3]